MPIRSSAHALKIANEGKKGMLRSLVKEYQGLAQTLINQLMRHN